MSIKGKKRKIGDFFKFLYAITDLFCKDKKKIKKSSKKRMKDHES